MSKITKKYEIKEKHQIYNSFAYLKKKEGIKQASCRTYIRMSSIKISLISLKSPTFKYRKCGKQFQDSIKDEYLQDMSISDSPGLKSKKKIRQVTYLSAETL